MKRLVRFLFIIGLMLCLFPQVIFADEVIGSPDRQYDETYSVYSRELSRANEWIQEAPDSELDKLLAV